jgi:hypothetical protein
MRDVNANVYVFHAYDAIHDQAIRGILELSSNSIHFDETTLETWDVKQGKLEKYARSVIKDGQDNAKRYAEQYGSGSPSGGQWAGGTAYHGTGQDKPHSARRRA